MCAKPFFPARYNPILVVPILAKARNFAQPISEIKVGDKIWQSLMMASRRDWLTVTKVGLGPEWGELKDGVWDIGNTIQLDLQDKKGNKSSYSAPSGTILERYSPWPRWAVDEIKKMEGISVTFVEDK